MADTISFGEENPQCANVFCADVKVSEKKWQSLLDGYACAEYDTPHAWIARRQ